MNMYRDAKGYLTYKNEEGKSVYQVTTKPVNNPFTLDEVKDWLKVDVTDDDLLISGLVTAATELVERQMGEAYMTQTIKAVFRNWCMELPLANVQSITSVKYYDTQNTLQTWSSSNYFVDTIDKPHKVERLSTVSFPSLYRREYPVEVIYVAGYGDNTNNVPYLKKLPILVKVAEWYDNRADRPWEKVSASDGMIRHIRVWDGF